MTQARTGHERDRRRLRRRRFPTVYYLRRTRARAHSEIRLRCDRRRRRHRRRHRPQCRGARRHRTDAALRHRQGLVRYGNRAVRPALFRAVRHRADGNAGHRLAGRGKISRARPRKRARVPYTAGTVASSTVEELAEARRGHAVVPALSHAAATITRYGFDLVRRAQAAGAHVLVITMDVPMRTKRPREMRHGLVLPFRMDARTVIGRADLAGVADGLPGARPGAVRQLQAIRRGRTDAGESRRRSPSAAIRPGAGVLVGRGQALSRSVERAAGAQGHHASAGRRQGRVAGHAMASRFPTTAAARSRGCQPSSTCCPRSSPRSAASAPPCCSIPACAQVSTSSARWRSARRPHSPARHFSTGSARSAGRARTT